LKPGDPQQYKLLMFSEHDRSGPDLCHQAYPSRLGWDGLPFKCMSGCRGAAVELVMSEYLTTMVKRPCTSCARCGVLRNGVKPAAHRSCSKSITQLILGQTQTLSLREIDKGRNTLSNTGSLVRSHCSCCHVMCSCEFLSDMYLGNLTVGPLGGANRNSSVRGCMCAR
jgi:hypothetical protein